MKINFIIFRLVFSRFWYSRKSQKCSSFLSFTDWRNPTILVYIIFSFLLFKVIKALLSRSAILFVYLPASCFEISVLRLLHTKKQTNISMLLANICLLLSFLSSKFVFSCLRLRFHPSSIFTITNKKTFVFRIILLVFPFLHCCSNFEDVIFVSV